MQADVEAVERQAEPLTAGLDVGLLPRPTGQERVRLERLGQRAQRGDLTGREEALRDALARELRSVELDVDADLAAPAEGVEGDSARVGEVEPRPGHGQAR